MAGVVDDIDTSSFYTCMTQSVASPALAPALVEQVPRLIKGGLGVDDRGVVAFINDFSLERMRRFYTVKNHRAGFIRAWHGHLREEKCVTVVRGAAVVGAVRLSDAQHPDPRATVERFVLSADAPSILCIPAGYANGAMTLTADTQLIYFSSSTLEDARGDDYRFPSHYWDCWSVEER